MMRFFVFVTLVGLCVSVRNGHRVQKILSSKTPDSNVNADVLAREEMSPESQGIEVVLTTDDNCDAQSTKVCCDAQKLLGNAKNKGDCPTTLNHGDSCAQTGVGNYSCSSTCDRGLLMDRRFKKLAKKLASCNFDYNNEFENACETISAEASNWDKGLEEWDDDYTGDGVKYRNLKRYNRKEKYRTSNSNEFFVGPQKIGGVLVYALTADGEIRPQIMCESNDPPSPVAEVAPAKPTREELKKDCARHSGNEKRCCSNPCCKMMAPGIACLTIDFVNGKEDACPKPRHEECPP